MTTSLVQERKDPIPITWGTEVSFNYDALSAACSKAVEPVDVELLRLAGAVAFADRVFRRSPVKNGWPRKIRVCVGVSNPDLWLQPAVRFALSNCLGFVTGDDWSFEFVHEPLPHVQLLLRQETDYDVVVPFSGGLDSFLASRYLTASGAKPLLMTARTTALVQRHVDAVTSAEAVGVPIRLNPGRHAEPSFRTRTFVFASVATVAARLSGASDIVIGENGQGSIGAGLVSFGAEPPYRTTHPTFTALYKVFLDALVGSAPHFRHPFVWKTKGSVLSELISSGDAIGWGDTVSCSRNLRRHKGVTEDRACGICGNCILRRVSAHAAGANDPTTYHWDTEAPNLAAAQRAGGSATTHTDHAYAARNILAMDALARLPLDSRRLHREAHLLSSVGELGDRAEVLEKLQALIRAHAAEWDGFLSSLPRSSWVLGFTEAEHGAA